MGKESPCENMSFHEASEKSGTAYALMLGSDRDERFKSLTGFGISYLSCRGP